MYSEYIESLPLCIFVPFSISIESITFTDNQIKLEFKFYIFDLINNETFILIQIMN